jgi:thiamine biosynthesis lipoprotein
MPSRNAMIASKHIADGCVRRGSAALAVALTALVALGCTHVPDAAPLHPQPVLVKRAQPHMGTVVTLTVVAEDKSAAERVVAAGFAEVRRLEELLSTWIPSSELSRVNEAAGRNPVTVSRDTMRVLNWSLEAAHMTSGAFNIAIGPAIEAWGFGRQERVPTEVELAALRPLTDLTRVKLDDRAGTVFLARSGMRLDVGGIGKGFAADLVIEAMQRAGAIAGVAALAGDIRTFGRMPEGERFVFGIRHPREEGGVLGVLELQDEAISTAGDYERFFEKDGIRYHHILDPSTLQPARDCQSVTIVAKEGVIADGLDTGVFVLGPERGMALIEQLPDVEGVIVDRDGRVRVSSGLRDRLKLVEPAR